MVRTIRNITFVVLCAMVYVTPVSVAAAERACWADYLGPTVEGSWVRHDYQGECSAGGCDTEAYNQAIDTCWEEHNYAIMVEHFCGDWDPVLWSFSCIELLFD
jgi:hypothetical protein